MEPTPKAHARSAIRVFPAPVTEYLIRSPSRAMTYVYAPRETRRKGCRVSISASAARDAASAMGVNGCEWLSSKWHRSQVRSWASEPPLSVYTRTKAAVLVATALVYYRDRMLSPELADQFQRDGFCSVPGFLLKGQLNALLRDLESISSGATVANHDPARMEMEPNQAPDGTRIRRLYEPCTHYPVFRSLSESSELLDCLEQLLGGNLLFHYSKLNMKPPAIGSVVEWHQDLAYYPLTNSDSLAVLFYLDDADRQNGCLQVLPAVHRKGLLDHTANGYFQGRITERVDEARTVAIEGIAGTALFLHGMTPHASAPNRSQRPRRTLILGYRAADAYPIYVGETTPNAERYVRLVRGEGSSRARLAGTGIPIPRYETVPKSLYELQQRFREQRAVSTVSP